jgi:outer membrane lipoprotein-sorting protein
LRSISLCYHGSHVVEGVDFSGGNLFLGKSRGTAICLCATICATLWFASGILTVGTQNHTVWTLEGVLRQMDVEAKAFHSLSADIERTKVTVVVNDRSIEAGSILVRDDKMLLDFKAPNARTILRTGDNLYIYTPGLNRVEEYNLGKNRALVDQFLLLGFGTESKELQKGYLVTLLKEDKLDDKKTIELELTPKSQAVRNQIAKIQIWLDESSWLPVQQQFSESGSGDYSIVHYTKVVRNPGLPDSKFKPRWPKGTEKIKPQG